MEDAITLPIGGQGKYGGLPKSRRYQPKSGGFHVREKINFKVLKKRTKDDGGVYTQKECSIPAGMGKYIPVI